MNRRIPQAVAAAGYIGSILAANIATAHHDPIHIAPWLLPHMTAPAGVVLAGLALLTRDFLQEAAGRRAVLVAIVIGAALSACFAGLHLALASAAAFALSETLDMAVYTPTRKYSLVLAVFVSNIVGAVVDTAVFLRLAAPDLNLPPGMSVWDLVPGQLFGKLVWATLLPAAVLLVWQRARANRRQAVSV